jgi:hypothetical protein
MTNSIRCVLAVLTAFFGLGSARAQIIELREMDGKRVTCVRTGMLRDLDDCGVRSDQYDYVFVGSISQIRPLGKEEEKLLISPQEIFLGEPPAPVAVLTSQRRVFSGVGSWRSLAFLSSTK